MFRKSRRITAFESTPNHNFIQDLSTVGIQGPLCYRIGADRMIEINDAYLKTPIVIRNKVSDLITFQFVSTVKRSEFLGKRKNVHDLGPALLVSAIPGTETTYRVPKTNVQIRHVAVHTTLSNLMERLAESTDAYPEWLTEILEGGHNKPRQRVFFLEAVHRDPIWSCFHLPVSGTLLGKWMSAKFDELLCIGLQILKNSRNLTGHDPLDLDQPCGEKIRRARTILGVFLQEPDVRTYVRVDLAQVGLVDELDDEHGEALRVMQQPKYRWRQSRRPVSVLTHHLREPLELEGGTTFTFVTEGIDAALERAGAPPAART